MNTTHLRAVMRADRLACRLAYVQGGECGHIRVTITARRWWSGLFPSLAYMREWSGAIA